MKRLKLFYLAYFIQVILLLSIVSILHKNVINPLLSLRVWIIPAISTILGFIIGAVVYELKLKRASQRTKIYIVGYTLAMLVMAALIAFSYSGRSKRDKLPNATANHDVMKFWVDENEQYIRVAFDTLEAKFEDPNDFELNSFSVRKIDTVANGIRDTIYNIYFTYHFKGNKDVELFSKVSVFRYNPSISFFNENIETSVEYSRVKETKRQSEADAIRSINETKVMLREMKDSMEKN